jgi:hypothetical protein
VSSPTWGEAPAGAPGPDVEPASTAESAEPGDAAGAAGKNVKLPGLVMNVAGRYIDIEASVCLEEGMLECIACTKGTKEHESIVAIEAKPSHIHVALLLLGAKPGNPAMRKRVDEQGTRWIDVPPKGDPVDVYLVFKDEKGQRVERPISRFVTRVGEEADAGPGVDEDDAGEDSKFPHTFLFAGSLVRGEGPGPRQYLSDVSGNVISVSTFGDELLCLPGVHTHANEGLTWEVDATELPKVGSKVTLRLRLRNQADPKAGRPGPVQTSEKKPQ